MRGSVKIEVDGGGAWKTKVGGGVAWKAEESGDPWGTKVYSGITSVLHYMGHD